MDVGDDRVRSVYSRLGLPLAGLGRRLVFLRLHGVRVEFGVLSVVARGQNVSNDEVQYVRDFEESSSDVIGYGMVPHSLSSSAGKVWRACSHFSLGQLCAGCNFMGSF